jgi:hypothetical protein
LELTPTHNIQTLKKVIGGLVGVIYIRVDLRLSKVMVRLHLLWVGRSDECLTYHKIKGFIGSPAVTDALKEAGFNIMIAEPTQTPPTQ